MKLVTKKTNPVGYLGYHDDFWWTNTGGLWEDFYLYPSLWKNNDSLELSRFKISQKEDEYNIELELAGVPRDKILIMVEDKGEPTVLVEWEKSGSKRKKDFSIPEGDKNAIVATYSDGLLAIKVPFRKNSPSSSFQIPIH